MKAETLQESLGYVFRDAQKLQQALTHGSFVHENQLAPTNSNERLEFLGDAVLELLASDFLYNRYPQHSEGELSKCRAGMVCEGSLAGHGRRLGLGGHLRLSRGETISGGAEKDSILSDALEAVIGAIFLDGGFDPARAFVGRLLAHAATQADAFQLIADPKSTLQEIIQRNSRFAPTYSITKEDGPPHRKEFTAIVVHDQRVLGTGVGKTKKDAERAAAAAALEGLDES